MANGTFHAQMVHFTHCRDATPGHMRRYIARAQAEARPDKTTRKDNRLLVAHTRRVDLEVAPFNKVCGFACRGGRLAPKRTQIFRSESRDQSCPPPAATAKTTGLPQRLAMWLWATCLRSFCSLACSFAPQPIFRKRRARRETAHKKPGAFVGVTARSFFARRNTMPPRSVLCGKGVIFTGQALFRRACCLPSARQPRGG